MATIPTIAICPLGAAAGGGGGGRGTLEATAIGAGGGGGGHPGATTDPDLRERLLRAYKIERPASSLAFGKPQIVSGAPEFRTLRSDGTCYYCGLRNGRHEGLCQPGAKLERS
jgi:hypothetical protein